MKELKFIHITKCAGSFISYIGRLHGLEWGLYHKEYSHNCKQHEIFSNKSEGLRAKYDWFVIVRNPYTRILSEYYYSSNTNHNAYDANKYLLQRIATRNYETYRFFGHFIEQYKYLDTTQTIHVIRYENMYNELKALFSTYNININLDNFIHKKKNYKEKFDKTIHFTTEDFSNTLIRYINLVYENDFKFFKYDQINTYDYTI